MKACYWRLGMKHITKAQRDKIREKENSDAWKQQRALDEFEVEK